MNWYQHKLFILSMPHCFYLIILLIIRWSRTERSASTLPVVRMATKSRAREAWAVEGVGRRETKIARTGRLLTGATLPVKARRLVLPNDLDSAVATVVATATEIEVTWVAGTMPVSTREREHRELVDRPRGAHLDLEGTDPLVEDLDGMGPLRTIGGTVLRRSVGIVMGHPHLAGTVTDHLHSAETETARHRLVGTVMVRLRSVGIVMAHRPMDETVTARLHIIATVVIATALRLSVEIVATVMDLHRSAAIGSVHRHQQPSSPRSAPSWVSSRDQFLWKSRRLWHQRPLRQQQLKHPVRHPFLALPGRWIPQPARERLKSDSRKSSAKGSFHPGAVDHWTVKSESFESATIQFLILNVFVFSRLGTDGMTETVQVEVVRMWVSFYI